MTPARLSRWDLVSKVNLAFEGALAEGLLNEPGEKSGYHFVDKTWWSAFNIRVVSGRVASPGEVLVVVLAALVVAFFLIVSVVALPLLLLLPRKPPPGPPNPPPKPHRD